MGTDIVALAIFRRRVVDREKYFQQVVVTDLLRIELEWIAQAGSEAARLSDAKLVLYNEVLREQVAELEMEVNSVPLHPRFLALQPYVNPMFGTASMDVAGAARYLRHLIGEVQAANTQLEHDDPRAALVALAALARPERTDFF